MTFSCAFCWKNLNELSSKILIDNKSALIQIMALRQTGDKPLPEPMMNEIHSVIWRQWDNGLNPINQSHNCDFVNMFALEWGIYKMSLNLSRLLPSLCHWLSFIECWTGACAVPIPILQRGNLLVPRHHAARHPEKPNRYYIIQLICDASKTVSMFGKL